MWICAIIGMAMIVNVVLESWPIAWQQMTHPETTRVSYSRKYGRSKRSFWSYLFRQMFLRWDILLSGCLLVLWCVWHHMRFCIHRFLGHDPEMEQIDESEIPDLEPIEGHNLMAVDLKATENTDEQLVRRKQQARSFQALMQQKEKFQDVVVEKPKGWLVYDRKLAKLVLAK